MLIPQPETFTKDGGQDQPPGFHVILLPFADDIRKPPKNITENVIGMFDLKRWCGIWKAMWS